MTLTTQSNNISAIQKASSFFLSELPTYTNTLIACGFIAAIGFVGKEHVTYQFLNILLGVFLHKIKEEPK
jgi:hypothetical protein